MSSVLDHETKEKMAEYWWKRLKLGTIIHYETYSRRFVRGTVVFSFHALSQKAEKCFLPVALVGEWPPHERTTRDKCGTPIYHYHARNIIEKRPWCPALRCIYESPSYKRSAADLPDPALMLPVDLKPPLPTKEQAVQYRMWKAVEDAQNALKDAVLTKDNNNKYTIETLTNEALRRLRRANEIITVAMIRHEAEK